MLMIVHPKDENYVSINPHVGPNLIYFLLWNKKEDILRKSFGNTFNLKSRSYTYTTCTYYSNNSILCIIK